MFMDRFIPKHDKVKMSREISHLSLTIIVSLYILGLLFLAPNFADGFSSTSSQPPPIDQLIRMICNTKGGHSLPPEVAYELDKCGKGTASIHDWQEMGNLLGQVMCFEGAQSFLLRIQCSCTWFRSLTWTATGVVNFTKDATGMKMYLSGEGHRGRVVGLHRHHLGKYGGWFDNKAMFCQAANLLEQTTPACFTVENSRSYSQRAFEEFLSMVGGKFIIFKPRANAGGSGIKVFTRKELATSPPGEGGVLQAYLNDPVLFRGFKTDIRVYFVVTSLKPLTLFISRSGMFRSAYPWKSFNSSTFDPAADITNYSFRIKAKKFVANSDSSSGEDATLGTLRKYWNVLQRTGLDPEVVWSNIKHNITVSLLALYPKLLKTNEVAEGSVFIADILISNTGHASVLEIMANACALKPKKEFAGDMLIWNEVKETVLKGIGLLSIKGFLLAARNTEQKCDDSECGQGSVSEPYQNLLVETFIALSWSYDAVLPLEFSKYKPFLHQQGVDTSIYTRLISLLQE
mmetsp:Transcript_3943/g.24889  ORF Transcript_3943/g.24889 Transcript_3943/m.24889 type:complete len:516 (-) Transcript_3943:1556-3103(-)